MLRAVAFAAAEPARSPRLCLLDSAGSCWSDGWTPAADGTRRSMLLTLALAVYTHYLLVSALLVFATYALYLLAGQARTGRCRCSQRWIFSGALVLPLAAQFSANSRQHPRVHTLSRPPDSPTWSPVAPPLRRRRSVGVGRMAAFSRKKDASGYSERRICGWRPAGPCFHRCSVFLVSTLTQPAVRSALLHCRRPGLAVLAGWAIRSAIAAPAPQVAGFAIFLAPL